MCQPFYIVCYLLVQTGMSGFIEWFLLAVSYRSFPLLNGRGKRIRISSRKYRHRRWPLLKAAIAFAL